eukprot:42-Chlamydomonas_euryale.AAC.2
MPGPPHCAQKAVRNLAVALLDNQATTACPSHPFPPPHTLTPPSAPCTAGVHEPWGSACVDEGDTVMLFTPSRPPHTVYCRRT